MLRGNRGTGVGVGVGSGVAVGVGSGVAVGDGVEVGSGTGVGSWVGAGAVVGSGAAVGSGVAVATGSTVAVGRGVEVAPLPQARSSDTKSIAESMTSGVRARRSPPDLLDGDRGGSWMWDRLLGPGKKNTRPRGQAIGIM